MNDRQLYLDVVLALNRRTQDGHYTWTYDARRERHVLNLMGKCFVLGKRILPADDAPCLRLYEEIPYEGIPDDQDPEQNAPPSGPHRGRLLFTFPPLAALDDLWDTVASGSTEAKVFLRRLLDEGIPYEGIPDDEPGNEKD